MPRENVQIVAGYRLREQAMAGDNVQVVEHVIAAVNERDIDSYLAGCSENIRLETLHEVLRRKLCIDSFTADRRGTRYSLPGPGWTPSRGDLPPRAGAADPTAAAAPEARAIRSSKRLAAPPVLGILGGRCRSSTSRPSSTRP